MVLAADLVEGLGAVARGVDAAARWSACVRRSARLAGTSRPSASRKPMLGLHAGGADDQVGLQHLAGGQFDLHGAAAGAAGSGGPPANGAGMCTPMAAPAAPGLWRAGASTGAGFNARPRPGHRCAPPRPCFSHQRRIMPPATGPIMRGTMRSPISTTLSCTPREARASMMMQPMKPAPICTTRAPGCGQGHDGAGIGQRPAGVHVGPLMPGIGRLAGDEPVAISSLSKGTLAAVLSDQAAALRVHRLARP
jgi:hypothetical protein